MLPQLVDCLETLLEGVSVPAIIHSEVGPVQMFALPTQQVSVSFAYPHDLTSTIPATFEL